MKKADVIKKIYAQGWVKKYINIFPVTGGIKVKGGLTRMNFASIKFQFHELGYKYSKEKKMFVKYGR